MSAPRKTSPSSDETDEYEIPESLEPFESWPPVRTRRSQKWVLLSTLGVLFWAGAMGLRARREAQETESQAVPVLHVEAQSQVEMGEEGAYEDAQAVQRELDAEGNAAGADAHADRVDRQAPLISASDRWLNNNKIAVPDVVTYTVRFGGTMRNIANLFKIYHHEIEHLNPGIKLDHTLPPNSKVVVYRRDKADASESIGFPEDGSLEGAVPVPEGPGRRLLAIPWKRWGTAHTVSVLDRVLRKWSVEEKSQPVLVGNLSARNGGRLKPHGSHRSGRDVDLGYLQKDGIYDELNWRDMNESNLDCARTWKLIEILIGTGEVEAIFIDRKLQKVLYDYAVEKNLYSRAKLRRLMEYPQQGGDALIEHVPGHVDHLHVRFRCPNGQKRCRSR